MNVKENLTTLELLAVCISQSKDVAKEIAGLRIDANKDGLVIGH